MAQKYRYAVTCSLRDFEEHATNVLQSCYVAVSLYTYGIG